MIERLPSSGLRLPVRLLLLVGVLVAGLLVGILAGRAARSSSGERVAESDYVVLVAHLYERERSIFNAQERLANQGIKNPASVVADLVNTYRNERPAATRDITSLEELAQALKRLGAEPASALAATAETSRSGSGSLVPALLAAFLVLTGAGALIAARVLGVNLVTLLTERLGWRNGVRAVRTSRWTSSARPGTPPPRRRPEPTRDAPSPRDPPSVRPVSSTTADPFDEGATPEVASLGGGVLSRTIRQPPARPTTSRNGSRTRYVFRSHYEYGEDQYEELHPIRDRATDRLLGACGLGATLRCAGGEAEFYAFTAWIQDYASQEFRSVGLTARWALAEEREAIDAWQESGVIDETCAIDRNASVRLDTRNFQVTVTVVDHELGADASRPPLVRLATRFEVARKLATPATVNGV
ncbi:MAG: hypothetical protein HYY04_06780 [Chloroflexi bacterium]|nr:hypothetical protein [Chloroflexota bacterium]